MVSRKARNSTERWRRWVSADDVAGLGVERGEQAGGAVAGVVVGAAFDLAGAHGQQRSGAVERLNLALFVHAQDQRAFGRVQVKAHDVAHLVDKQRVARQLECLRPLRRQRKGAPDAMNAGAAESGLGGHGARGPVRGVVRPRLQRQRQDTLDVLVAQLARGAGTGLVEQAVDAAVEKTTPPLAHRLQRGGDLFGDGGVAQPAGGQQDDPRPYGQGLGRLAPSTPRDQLTAWLFLDRQRRKWTALRHRSSPTPSDDATLHIYANYFRDRTLECSAWQPWNKQNRY